MLPDRSFVSRPVYPFAAIVGQEEMQKALLIAAVDPNIGGVLLYGERGTGKTTAVRGLREILPEIIVSADNPYNDRLPDDPAPVTKQRPLIDLPLGTTEDRLLGSIQLEYALQQGKKVFEPGILAKANRGILYIDEINLLDDSLIDLLLDVAASKENIVEREGISVRHPSHFVLVGSCNPEEGELRPQLTDRFGLSVRLQREDNEDIRAEVVRRRIAFEDDPEAFIEEYSELTDTLRMQISSAIALISTITIPDAVITRAAEISKQVGTEGHRAELAMVRAARAMAALEGRPLPTVNDVDSVALMCLRHRIASVTAESMYRESEILAVINND